MNRKYSISVIFPVYNEEGNIERVIQESADFLQATNAFEDYEIIAVNDGSKDNTAQILQRLADAIPFLKVITHRKNLGYGLALSSGFKEASFPLILFMDADGQFNINEVKKLFFYLEEFDIIAGSRQQRKDARYRITLAGIYSWLVFVLFSLRLKDVNCGFKLFKRKALELENLSCKAGVFYTEFLIRARERGCKIKEVPVEHLPRLKGRQNGVSLKIILEAVIDLVRLKYSLNKR